VRVPQDAEITVSLDHDRKAFGTIKGDEKKDKPEARTTPGGAD